MSSSQVLLIIASLDGGFNGDVLGKRIGVEILSESEAIYTLTQYVDDQPTDQVERYLLTLTELPPEPVEPEEPAAAEPPVEMPEAE
ncbi:hypothetical protein SEA_PHINKY_47 [Microbacterium phage Phinky]|nr:hypothetical protein SEA_PHINKY_47 [Microbacterium phage Phinky]